MFSSYFEPSGLRVHLLGVFFFFHFLKKCQEMVIIDSRLEMCHSILGAFAGEKKVDSALL